MRYNSTAIRPCPICDHTFGIELTKLNYALFDDLDISGTKTLFQCGTCGMLYDDVPFSEEQLLNYYWRNEHYAVSDTGGTGGLSDDNKARYDRIINLLKPDRNGLVLDIGCGQGGFVSRCCEYKINAAGIEISDKSREKALDAGLDVSDSIETFIDTHPSDVVRWILMSHVIEHMLNPHSVLEKLSKYMPGALIYIEVPDAASYLTPNNVHWPEMYFEHLSHFHQKNISELARRSGIQIISDGVIPFSVAQPEVQCRFLIGIFPNIPTRIPINTEIMDISVTFNYFPEVPGKQLDLTNQPLALWGVSQYAMLLLGSNRWRSRLMRLFDISPAKLGRTIGGVKLEHPKMIATLPKDTLLILPRSPAISQMKVILKNDIDYTGDLLVI